MKSMTGYAYRETANDRLSLALELKAYNNRFLDIHINLPTQLSPLEPRLRQYLLERCERGKVELNLRIRETAPSIVVSLNTQAAKAYYEAISQLADQLGLPKQLNLEAILGLEGVLLSERHRDPELVWTDLVPLLEAVFTDFESCRCREGEATERDILKHLAEVEAALAAIRTQAPQIEAVIKDGLRQRFREVLGDQIDDNRVLAETAVLLLKYTIAEELARLQAQIDEFRSEMARNSAPGKKLDFLCQEMNREVNTIGSKSQLINLSQLVVDMKHGLENIREQLRNVE